MVQHFPKSSKKMDKIGKILGEFSKVGAWNQALLSQEKHVFLVSFSLTFPRFLPKSKTPTKYLSMYYTKHNHLVWLNYLFLFFVDVYLSRWKLVIKIIKG